MKLSKIKALYNKKDRMHNWAHIIRLKSKVNILKKPYKKLDKELLNFLILFHGLKDYVINNKKDFDKRYVQCLLRHKKNPKRIEEKIVFDANMFDNIGKQGVKKALLFGRYIGRTKQNTFRYLEDNISKARFYTKLGKQLGKKQIALMKDIINKSK